MLRIMLAALLLAGCTVTPKSYTSRDDISAERREESVRRMQDEFNALTGNAF